eukprot:7389692-Pyramimonas_sp.AAC.1
MGIIFPGFKMVHSRRGESTHHASAAGGAVELGEDEARERHLLVELARLVQHVQPGSAVQHQQHLPSDGPHNARLSGSA